MDIIEDIKKSKVTQTASVSRPRIFLLQDKKACVLFPDNLLVAERHFYTLNPDTIRQLLTVHKVF